MNQTLRDMLASVLRTAVPAAVGAALAWVAAKYNIVLSEDATAQAKGAATVLATASYYALIRLLEKKVKWASWLLGYPLQPTYEKPAA